MTLPITSGTIAVGTTPVQLDGTGVSPIRIYVRNNDSTKTLYVGNGTVTVADGFPIDKLSTQDFLLFPNQSLWIVSSDTGHSVSWMRIPV